MISCTGTSRPPAFFSKIQLCVCPRGNTNPYWRKGERVIYADISMFSFSSNHSIKNDPNTHPQASHSCPSFLHLSHSFPKSLNRNQVPREKNTPHICFLSTPSRLLLPKQDLFKNPQFISIRQLKISISHSILIITSQRFHLFIYPWFIYDQLP